LSFSIIYTALLDCSSVFPARSFILLGYCPSTHCVPSPSLELLSYSEHLYLSMRILSRVSLNALDLEKHPAFHQQNVYHIAMRSDIYKTSERWDKEIRVSVSCFLLLLPRWSISIPLRSFGDWCWFRLWFGPGLLGLRVDLHRVFCVVIF